MIHRFTMLSEYAYDTISLSESDGQVAQSTHQALSHMKVADMPQYLHFTELPQEVVIPRAALPLISQMLDAMSRGQSVRLMAESGELTPQQAAKMLGASRPLVMHLVKQNTLPHRRVGSHYRLPLQAVVNYQKEKQHRRALLNQLTAEAQDLDMD